MKTNAPEKIYITPRIQRRWFSKEIDDVSVEYTRTNVLIEDACKWLKENAYLYVNDYTGSLYEDKLIEDFRKNYMEVV